MSSAAILQQQLADARRTLARIDRRRAKYVAWIERLQRELQAASDAPSPTVVHAMDYDVADEMRWLRNWVHVGTGEIISPWDELTWADLRKPSSEFPTLGSVYSVTVSNEPNAPRIVGCVMGVQYHRRLAMIRTADGDNYAGPMRDLRHVVD